MISIDKLRCNEKNPRTITRENFEKLKRSIKEFERMLAVRPLLVDMRTGIVYGGNMRLRALKALGYKEIPDEWVKDISHLTDAEKRELVIKDNVSYGDWDFDLLTALYENDELEDWGVSVISFDNDEGKKIFEGAEGIDLENQYVVEVILENEKQQQEIYERLTKEGYKCRILTL
jgi:ParB-like chromosome segregation protein Spo0J